MDASTLLNQIAERNGWSAEDKVAMICAYADLQDSFWNTPSLPGSKPVSFAEFMAEIESAVAEAAAEYEASGELTNEEALALDEEAGGPPPLTDGALLSKPADADAVVTRHEKTIALTVPQNKKASAALGDEYDPDAENAPAEGEVLVGPLVASFVSSAGDPVELSVSVRAGRPACFVQAILFVKGKEVKYLSPRHKAVAGEYSVEYGGAVYKLSVVPPRSRGAK